ncbi:MAG TPA: DNA gyrase subunit A [Clostridiales bacterium]|nr:DNA gyrase subunit A [Clostridiales bacterium]
MDSVNQTILNVNLEEEMKKSYIDYAMSVIVGRALPDVRDGLKPVHRRILYSMHELGMTSDKPYRKSARIVGDVLGKYHPHGDTAVYDAMVRMAQDFSIRYPLIDGHGNFGSVDGDSPAAMRYTEARMAKITAEIMADLGKDTVDFMPNFDESLKEPVVLPARFPNLLVNGSSGIAVGMATNIPPHNMGEVIDGTIAIIDNPEVNLNELISIITGPDFPTGALILGRSGIREAYRTGRGRILMRARTDIQEMSNNRSRIVVTEIPYQVNKSKLIKNIADLVKDKRLEGISDIRDESDRSGMSIVIELKKDVNPNVVLNYLYKHTQLQDTFGVIMIALHNNEPKIMNIKEILVHYIDHQKDVLTRRTRYELDKAEARAHILDGLLMALDQIDAVISLIRGSRTTPEAKEGLISQFNLSDKQAQAILDMRLQRLTGLEREKIQNEYDELQNTIQYLNDVLQNESMLMGIIKDELIAIKNRYNDDRRTEIIPYEGDIDVADLIDEHDVVVTLTHYGYVKRTPLSTYRTQHRGGRGITGLQTREEDFIEDLFVTSTHQRLLFFSSKGKAYELKAYEIPEASRQGKGTAIINLLQLDSGERIEGFIPVKDEQFDMDMYLFMGTRNGLIKKTPLKDFANIRKGGLIAITLREEDEMIGAILTDGKQEVIMASHKGMAIRFHESNVRSMGRTAMGVKSMNLKDGDYVIDMERIIKGADILTISENGFGKRTPEIEYRTQKRGGIGIKTMNITSKTGELSALKVVTGEEDLIMINSNGVIIRIDVQSISKQSRNTQGVTLMRVEDGNHVVSVAKAKKEEEALEDIDMVTEVTSEETSDGIVLPFSNELSLQDSDDMDMTGDTSLDRLLERTKTEDEEEPLGKNEEDEDF